jgi:hypothetical protein
MSVPFEWAPAALSVDVVAAADTRAAAFTQGDRLLRVRDPVGFEEARAGRGAAVEDDAPARPGRASVHEGESSSGGSTARGHSARG